MRRARVQVPLHAAVSVLLTWPLALHLTDSLPLGNESSGTVPRVNLWTLRWNELQLGDLYRHYWDAPIFHPTPGAFALSEPQPLTGLVFAPIAWSTRNPVLAYNLVLLMVLTLNGWAAARLARRLGGSAGPAAAAGVLAQALPFVAAQLGVLQLTVVFPIFLLLDAVLAWAPAGGRTRAAAIGGWLAVAFLTCGYYGLFAAVAVGLAGLTLVRRSWLSVARAVDAGVAAAVFALLALPWVIGQSRVTHAYARSEATITALSAQPIDYVRLWPRAWGWSGAPWLAESGGSQHWLYPGTVLLAAGVGGVGVAFHRARRARRGPGRAAGTDGRAEVADVAEATPSPGLGGPDGRTGSVAAPVFLLAVGAVALVASFGLRLDLAGWRPYDVLRDHVPGFASLRSPYRFAVIVQLVLVPFAGLAFDALWRRPLGRARRGGALAVVGLVVLGVVEVAALPIPLATVDPVEPAVTEWVSWLAARPDGRPVAMVPFPSSGKVEAYGPTVEAMLAGLDHGHPLVNGYSGLFPPSYDSLEAAMQGFPSRDAVDALVAAGTGYVVVDRTWLTPEREAGMQGWARQLVPVLQGRDVVVYRLVP